MWYLVPLVMCGSMVGRIHRPNKGGPLVSWGPGCPRACTIGVAITNLTEAGFGASRPPPPRAVRTCFGEMGGYSDRPIFLKRARRPSGSPS
jgi:hypothetical protein